jgi:DNA-binding MarR family transcriptional regulator
MVKPSGLSHRLARLEKMGLVVRDVDPDDRRSILVTITPAGRDVADRAVEITARRQRELLAGLTESRRRDLHEAADALVRHLSGELVTPR